jgi:hypothetical protein
LENILLVAREILSAHNFDLLGYLTVVSHTVLHIWTICGMKYMSQGLNLTDVEKSQCTGVQRERCTSKLIGHKL